MKKEWLLRAFCGQGGYLLSNFRLFLSDFVAVVIVVGFYLRHIAQVGLRLLVQLKLALNS